MQFHVRSYFALQFAALRQLCLNDPDSALTYIESLARGSDWATSAGKSGSSFFRTLDGRFIFKVGTR